MAWVAAPRGLGVADAPDERLSEELVRSSGTSVRVFRGGLERRIAITQERCDGEVERYCSGGARTTVRGIVGACPPGGAEGAPQRAGNRRSRLRVPGAGTDTALCVSRVSFTVAVPLGMRFFGEMVIPIPGNAKACAYQRRE